MAQPEPEQRPSTDDEVDKGRKRLADFFDEITDDLANETGHSAGELRPSHS